METSTSPQMISYPTVDIRALVQAIKNISRLALFRTPNLPSVEENARRAGAYARELDQAIRTALPRLATELRDSAADSGYVNTLAEIDAALASLPADHISRATLDAERSKISARIAQGARRLAAAFAEHSAALSAAMLDLRRVTLAERVQTVLDEQQTQLAQIKQEMAEIEQRRALLHAQRKTVIESLDLLRKQNVFDIINDAIPSGSDIGKLDLSNPKMEMVKQALDITKKLLDKLSDSVKYGDLVEARNVLDARIDAASEELNALSSKASDSQQLLNGLNDALQLADERAALLAQADTIREVWEAFATRLQAMLNDGDYAGAITGMLQGQCDFLYGLTKELGLAIVE